MKKLLVVVDMQNDFITGALGNDECRSIVSDVVNKVDNFIKENDENSVIFTQDTHSFNYLETQEGKNLSVTHCVEGTKGWQIIPELESYVKTSIKKNTFGSVELAKLIQNSNFEEVELIGVCTGICVISNAMTIKAFAPEVKINVDSKCCACVTPKSHETALEAMKLCQINVY